MKAKLAPTKILRIDNIDYSSATVEEALHLTGFGKYNFGLLLVCSWMLQSMGMDLFGTSFIVAASVCDLELDLQQRALLSAMPLIGVVLGAQLWGYISDTRGRRYTLILSMSIGFVFAALSSFSPDWKTMAVLKLLSSTFTSATNSAAYTLLGESCCGRVRGRAMLLCNCALMCAQGTAAVLAYPILPLDFEFPIEFLNITYRPWRLLTFVIASPCAITACLLFFFHESPKFLASRGRFDDAHKVLKSIYAINTGTSPDNFPVKKLIPDQDESSNTESDASFLRSLWVQTAALFKKPLMKRTLHLFYLVVVVYMTGSGFILWLPYILNKTFIAMKMEGGGDGMTLCSIISSSESSFNNNGTLLSTQICDDTIQESTLFSAMTYGAVASSVNLVLSLTGGSRKRVACLLIISTSAVAAILLNVVMSPLAGVALFFIFLMSALSMGILSVYFVELYPTSLRGMASCLSVMVGRTSAFVGVNMIGALLASHCEVTFYAWSGLLASAVVFAWFLPKDGATEA